MLTEYVPLQDLSITEIFEPKGAACGSDSSMYGVIIKNLASMIRLISISRVNIAGFTVNETYNYTGTLLAGQKDTVWFTTVINTIAGGIATVTTYSALAGDQYSLNDTVSKTITYYGIPASPIMAAPNPGSGLCKQSCYS